LRQWLLPWRYTDAPLIAAPLRRAQNLALMPAYAASGIPGTMLRGSLKANA
jgi:hypothetical protein